MATIAYVGNFRHPWCTEVHVAGSLELLGHRVLRLQENELRWQGLPRLVDRNRVELVLWTRTWDVPADAVHAVLDQCRAQGVPSVFYHLDRWWGLEREYQVATMPWFQATDVTFSPDGGNAERWAEVGVRHVWLPPGVYGPECGRVAANPARWPHEVVFVGSYPYPHPGWADYRNELIETLLQEYGARFGAYPQGSPVRGRDLQELYSTAKVVVGDSCLAGGATHYWSDRIPETLGRGGLLIHPHVEGLDDWYPNVGGTVVAHADLVDLGPDLLTYTLGEFDQVLALTDWALSMPEHADRVREHGRATVLARDTYQHRMGTVLQWCRDNLGLALPLGGAVRPQGGRSRAAAPTTPDRAPEAASGLQSLQRRHASGARGTLYVRAGHPTDAEVVDEVWTADQYQLTRQQVAGKVVVDIGANIGAFSVLALRLGAAQVYAHEPEPGNAKLAQHNLVLATGGLVGAGPEWHLTQCAVGAEDGQLQLAPGPGGQHGGGTHVVMAAVGGQLVDAHPVTVAEVVAIDSVLRQATATANRVGLLKLDAEGAEYGIIEAADPELLARVDRIAMEWHGPGMPHLTHLAELAALPGDGWGWVGPEPEQAWWAISVWGPMVAKLASLGRVRTFGRPWMGGLLYWEAY